MSTTTKKPPQTDKAARAGRGVASADTRRKQSAEAKAARVAAVLSGAGKKKPAKTEG